MKQLYYPLLTLLRGRGNHVSRIISLTLGLFIGILLFACVAFQLSFNRCFHRAEQLWQMRTTLVENGVPGDSYPFVFGPFAKALREHFPDQVEAVTVMREKGLTNYYHGDVRLPGQATYADEYLFSTLGIRVLAGNPADLAAADAMFVSRSYADKLREGEALATVVGKQLTQDKQGKTYFVRGIFEDLSENTDFPFDVVVPMEELWQNKRAGWGFDLSYNTLVRFRNRADMTAVEARLRSLVEQYAPDFNARYNKSERDRWEFSFRPLLSVHGEGGTARTMTLVMSVLAVAILLIAAFNYVLISISSLVHRAKAVGVHKCSGAGRGTIFSMFLTETALTVLLSVALAALLMHLFRDYVEETAAVRLASLFGVQTLWVPALVVLAVFLLAGVLPAMLFSAVPVTQVFRRYTERNKWWKRLLLFVQFAGTAFICCFLLVVYGQYRSVVGRPMGYDPARVVTLRADAGDYDTRTALFRNLPMVEACTSSLQHIIGGYSGDVAETESGRQVNCRAEWVARDFLPTMKIELLEGRNFDPAARKDGDDLAESDEVLVSELFVRQAGYEGSAVGRKVKCGVSGNKEVTIVGVMRDYRVESAYAPPSPLILFFNEQYGHTHYLRLKEPFADNLVALNRELETLFRTNFVEAVPLERQLEAQYTDVHRFRNAVLLAAIAILLIALMGLLGYTNDEVSRRSKEIAIRKINGSEPAAILRLLLRDVLWMALPAVVIGTLLSARVGTLWQGQFSDVLRVSPWLYAGCAACVLGLVVACVVWKAWRIALENPVRSLRCE